ncbi:Transcriptional regulator [Sphingobium yanoikuyae]|uniref:Helix-turn-helix domain-containing protein n=1 Tax=Sphingobium yanoikuyae TaxID=13690 RepID=A0A084E210_SPHYA|nr:MULTISPECIES: IclR family transcriptional regulator C-terminal domain-containing protein [Sphingomonadaceae]KEZ12002.1 Transcriptional regulator [Sphingobium yanoikuyae]MDF0490141.1 IclR family transcriptional regulator C-terminal domain-containing protein [Sphingomonas pollutisoli]QJR06153.1 helix-turn-helix domain-containing protein [Sphingobium yanoikuyae]QXF14297.1 helix-turn-helix domain-containing protein [Sphingopyxis terrae subsp. terrae]QXF14327.1 helix-turn-helix domain-containing
MKTIRKIGEVLRCFSATQSEHSVTALSRAIGNSISGTHDLVDGLAGIGLLRKVERGRYRLGPLVATLYHALEDSFDLVEVARPVMAQLSADHGETLHLTMHDHDRLLLVDAIDGTRPLRVSSGVIGPHLPLHKAPPGRLHLAAFSPMRLDDWLDEHARPGGPIDAPERLRDELAALAAEGFDSGPIGDDDDLVCLAAQIRDHVGRAVAVLSMTVPASRHARQPRAFRTITVDAAQRISDRLGHRRRDP